MQFEHTVHPKKSIKRGGRGLPTNITAQSITKQQTASVGKQTNMEMCVAGAGLCKTGSTGPKCRPGPCCGQPVTPCLAFEAAPPASPRPRDIALRPASEAGPHHESHPYQAPPTKQSTRSPCPLAEKIVQTLCRCREGDTPATAPRVKAN